MGRKDAFIIGFEKQAKKAPLLKRVANYLKNPVKSEQAIKKTNKYRASNLALRAGIPIAGTAYLYNKLLTGKGAVHPQKMKPTPEYY